MSYYEVRDTQGSFLGSAQAQRPMVAARRWLRNASTPPDNDPLDPTGTFHGYLTGCGHGSCRVHMTRSGGVSLVHGGD